MNEQKATLNVNGMKIEIKVVPPEITGTIGISFPRENKTDVFEYCKINKMYAAKDEDGEWWAYSEYPQKKMFHWVSPTSEWCPSMRKLCNDDYIFPDLPWDEIVIGPNDDYMYYFAGRPTQWEKVNNGKINKLMKWYATNTKTVSKKTDTELKRGDPVFVWDGNYSEDIPAIVLYFHSYGSVTNNKGIIVFSIVEKNERGGWYQYWRKFDPALVGVPRKDWPKE